MILYHGPTCENLHSSHPTSCLLPPVHVFHLGYLFHIFIPLYRLFLSLEYLSIFLCLHNFYFLRMQFRHFIPQRAFQDPQVELVKCEIKWSHRCQGVFKRRRPLSRCVMYILTAQKHELLNWIRLQISQNVKKSTRTPYNLLY